MVAGSKNADGSVNWLPFIGLLQLHMLCYMPTIGLTNTLGLRNLSDAAKQFPLIRVFGTIGWIVAGVVVSKMLGADKSALPLQVAGGACLAMGVYSFTLPRTPPAAGPKPRVSEILGLDALRAMSSVSFWVFIVASMLICIPLSAYYAFAPVFVEKSGIADPAFKMTFGQMSEIFFMIVMPLCFVRLGAKWMLLIGMLAWVVRYGLFAGAAIDHTLWMILGGIILHGICYDFFFVTGYIYADSKAPAAMRGQAQGFLVLVTLGIGMLVGGIVAGKLFNGIVVPATPEEAGAAWRQFWMIPAIFAGMIMVIFALLFKDDGKRRLSEAELAEAEAAETLP
jgi:nucleoside transporter